MTTRLEPKDKLGAAPVGVVNGPEDVLDWHAVDWRALQEQVRRLRQRIFTSLLEPDAWKTCTAGSETKLDLAWAGGSTPAQPGLSFVAFQAAAVSWTW